MEKKYLQVRKENILTKIVNFIKRKFFKSRKNQIIQESEQVNKKENPQSDFIDRVRIYKVEKSELLQLQRKFENNEIDFSGMSDKEVHELNSLYERQVSDLQKKLDDKKTEMGIIKSRINNYLTNM